MNSTEQPFPVGSIAIHHDPLLGDEDVKIVLGPLEHTTADGTYYVVHFLNDDEEQNWVCHSEDLRKVS